VTKERALVSVIGPTAGSGVRIEHWRYTAAFSRGPGRPCHTVFLNPPGIRYEGRIGDRHVRYDGAQHSIGGISMTSLRRTCSASSSVMAAPEHRSGSPRFRGLLAAGQQCVLSQGGLVVLTSALVAI
jgi:hypothetical protein